MKNIFSAIAGKVKYLFSINWYATFKVNFSLLPYRQARHLPIMIMCKVKLTDLSGRIMINCPIRRGIVVVGTKREMITTIMGVSQLAIGGDLVVNGSLLIADDVRIVVRKGATLTIGEDSYLGRNTCLIVTNDVCLGKCFRLTYDSQLVSTNFHYMVDISTHRVKRMSKTIIIKDYCWVGNSTTIMPGTMLPENTIIASHSLVNKDFSNVGIFPLIGGIPAKLISSGRSRVYNEKTESIINKYFKENPNENEFDITDLDIF